MLLAVGNADPGTDWGVVAAFISAGIAVLAVLVSAVLWRSERKDRRSERAEDQALARDEAEKRARLEGQVAELQRAQAEALGGMAQTIAAAVDPVKRQLLGAAISITTVITRPSDSSTSRSEAWLQGRDQEVVFVRNLGPGGCRITDVEILDRDSLMYVETFHGTDDLVPGGVHELLPDEEFGFHIVRGHGAAEVTVVVSWLDGTGEHQRERVLARPH